MQMIVVGIVQMEQQQMLLGNDDLFELEADYL
jgi:hypothetical protein